MLGQRLGCEPSRSRHLQRADKRPGDPLLQILRDVDHVSPPAFDERSRFPQQRLISRQLRMNERLRYDICLGKHLLQQRLVHNSFLAQLPKAGLFGRRHYVDGMPVHVISPSARCSGLGFAGLMGI